MRISILNRDNICEMEGVCDANGRHFHRDNGSYPCFHAAFSFMDQPGNVSKTYTIDYKLHMRKNYDNRNNNFVVLSKKDMCRLLNSFKMSIFLGPIPKDKFLTTLIKDKLSPKATTLNNANTSFISFLE